MTTYSNNIAAWIIYGIWTAMSLAFTIVGFLVAFLLFFWEASLVILWAIAGGLMLQYTKLARRRQTTTTFDNTSDKSRTVSTGDAYIPKEEFSMTPVTTTAKVIEVMEKSLGRVSLPRLQDSTVYASAVEVDRNTDGYLLTAKD